MFNKKRIIVFVGFILLLFFMTTFAGGPSQNETIATRLVTFIDGLTSAEISKQEVEVGGDAEVPDAPTHYNYVFVGWFEGEVETKEFKNILKNLTVTAKYAADMNNNGIADDLEDRYTVTFRDSRANTTLEVQEVLPGMSATAPVAPTYDGYTFVGWSGDYTNVTSNRTINTVYSLNETQTLETFTVTFVDGDTKEIIDEQTVGYGLTATLPVAPKHQNRVFTNWSGDYTNITSSRTITAIYADDLNNNEIDDELDNKYSVEFISIGNGTLDGTLSFDNILEGLTLNEALVTIPTTIANVGSAFNGWLVEPTLDTVVNSDLVFTAVFADITFTAPTKTVYEYQELIDINGGFFTIPNSDGTFTNVDLTLDMIDKLVADIVTDSFVITATEPVSGIEFTFTLVVKDTVRPTFDLVLPTEGQCLNASDVPAKAIASDNHKLEIITINLYDETNKDLIKSSSTRGINDVTGTHEFNFANLNLADGKYVIRANAKDVSGNTSVTISREFCIDSTKPEVKVNLNRESYLENGGVTRSAAKPEIEVTEINLANITIYKEGKYVTSWDTVNPVVTRKGISWLGEGTYTIIATDKAGNASDPFVVTIDNTIPTVEVVFPEEGQVLIPSKVRVEVIGKDNYELSRIVANLYDENGKHVGWANGYFSGTEATLEKDFANLNLADGKYYFKANVLDKAGNMSTTITRNFVVDGTAPVLKVVINRDNSNKTYLNDGAHANQSQKPEFEVTDNNLDKMVVMNANRKVVKVYEGPYKYNPSYNKFSHLSDGTYILVAYDKAGNVSNEFTITLDSKAPTASVVYSPETITRDKVIATVTFSEPINGKPRLREGDYDGGTISGYTKCNEEMTVCTLQHWGNRDYVIEFNDAAGNKGEFNIKFNNIDKKAPVIDSVTHNPETIAKEVTVTVTAHDIGDTVNGDKNGQVAGLHESAYSFDGGKNWQKENTYEVTENTTLNISVRDALGNVASYGNYEITNIKTDEIAPVITVLGSNPTYVLENGTYTELGATALDETDGDLTSSIITSGSVDTTTIETYTITYTVSDLSGNKATATRTVKVLDPKGDEDRDGFTNEEELNEGTDPEDKTDFPILGPLTLTVKPATIIFIYPNENGLPELSDIMDGVTATDSLGATVPVKIDKELDELTLGFNKITYTAEDRSGNKETKSRIVTLNNKCLDDNNCYEVISKPTNLVYNIGDTNYGLLDLEVKMNLAIAVPNITASKFTITPLADLTATPGVKTVTATYLYRANTVIKTVTVTFDITVVDNISPVITVDPTTVNMTYGDDLNVLEGVTALDNVDGDLTSSIIADKTDTTLFTLGENTVTYTVSDSSGNSEIKTRTYYVKRTTEQVNDLATNVVYNPAGPSFTKESVTATVTFSEDVTITNNSGSSYVFTENGSFTLEFKDKDGVEGSVDLAVDWIDKTAPTITVDPSKVTIAKGTTYDLFEGVTASDDLSGLATLVADKEFSELVLGENVVTYTATDNAGNIATATRTITLTITSEELASYATITYDPTSLTKGSVTATISFSESDITVTNNGGSTSYVFTENGTFTFEFEDKYGVTATKTAEVTWIDNVLPEATFTYSPEGWSNSAIEVTLTATEAITTPAGWTKVKDTVYTKVFTNYQSTVSVLLTDAAGNVNTVNTGEIKVDKVAPSINIPKATIDAGNQATVDVNVNITDNLSGVKVAYYIPVSDKLGFNTSTPAKALEFIRNSDNASILPGLEINGGKFTVVSNGEYWIYAIDNAGNETISNTKITVTNLYEPDPTETDEEEGFVDPVTGLRVTVSKQKHDYKGLFLRLNANRTITISNNGGKEVAEVRLAQGAKTVADFQNNLTLGTTLEINDGSASNKVESAFTIIYTVYFKNTDGNEQVHVFYNSSYLGLGLPGSDLFWKWGRI